MKWIQLNPWKKKYCFEGESEKVFMKKIIFILFTALLCIGISPSLFPVSPTILFGLGVKTVILPDEQENTLMDFLGHTDGLLSYRNKIGKSGYYALLVSADCYMVNDSPYLYADEEIISLETGYRFSNSTLIGKGIFHSSIMGTETDLSFFSPEWEILYYFITERKKIQPFVSYQGYFLGEPESNEDIFYEGAEVGFKLRPRITRGYKVSMGIGWEHWPEYPVYSFPNTITGESRNDIIGIITGKMDGIFRYFLDWEIILSVIYRWSNAAMYYDDYNYFSSDNEDRLVLESEIICTWSPSRYFHIKLHPFFTPEIFTARKALIEPGTISDETLWSVTTGGDFRIDWTPDNTFYAYATVDGIVYVSNEMIGMEWNLTCDIGIEYSLKL
jgi:hypothetical protein